MNGKEVIIDLTLMSQVVDNYDPAYHEAQLAIGHEDEGPSKGRVERLYIEDRVLKGDLAGVQPLMALGMVDGGPYPRRSAELYGNLDGRGPYLKNLSLLGVSPPAIKGLSKVAPTQVIMPQPRANVTETPAFAMSEGDGGDIYTFTYKGMKEVSMPDNNDEILHLKEAQLAKDAEIAKLQEQLKNTVGENVALAEAKKRYEGEIKLAETKAATATYLSELKTAKRCTPGMEPSLSELLTVAAFAEPVKIGDKTYNLGEMVKAVMGAMPEVLPTEGQHKPDEADKTKPHPGEVALSEAEIATAKAIYPEGSAEYTKHIELMKQFKLKEGQNDRN
jgi:hypothetical protein